MIENLKDSPEEFEDYDSEEEEVSKAIRCIINFIEEEPESISI